MTLTKKEIMNRSLSAMTINIGKAGVNENVIEEIKRQLKDNEIVKLKFARNIAISVAVYILSIVMIILFSTLVDQPIIGVCLFFILISIATGVIIYSSIVYSKEKEKVITKKEEKKNNTVKQICNIVDLLGLVIYFIVSFGTGAWYITWVIFLIIGLCEAIVKLIFNIKDDDCENCCEKDKCEKDE